MDDFKGSNAKILNDWSRKEFVVPESVLEAIRHGKWDFEPSDIAEEEYNCTAALPGSNEKISALAERAEEGLPLWHPADRRSFDDSEDAYK